MQDAGCGMQDAIWGEVVGQEEAVARLKKAIQTGSLSHAYLFVGPPGVGKTTAALAFAASINCSKADLCCISPKGNHLGIDQIREITSGVHLKPFEGEWKLYIIKSVNKMTQEAANAFLKGLEEPPPQVIFILTTSNVEGVTPTIVSRCQIISFRRVSTGEVEEALKARYQLDKGQADLIARLSRGVFSRAVEMAENKESLEKRDQILHLISEIREKDTTSLFNLKEKLFAAAGGEIEEILALLFSWCRDALVLKETGKESLLLHVDQRDLLERFIQDVPAERLSMLMDVLRESAGALRYNVNKDLMMEKVLISVHDLLTTHSGG